VSRMPSRERASLDRYITGNWGEDQVRAQSKRSRKALKRTLMCQTCRGSGTTPDDESDCKDCEGFGWIAP
jgi:DnaJ-class molecular chaperone